MTEYPNSVVDIVRIIHKTNRQTNHQATIAQLWLNTFCQFTNDSLCVVADFMNNFACRGLLVDQSNTSTSANRLLVINSFSLFSINNEIYLRPRAN